MSLHTITIQNRLKKIELLYSRDNPENTFEDFVSAIPEASEEELLAKRLEEEQQQRIEEIEAARKQGYEHGLTDGKNVTRAMLLEEMEQHLQWVKNFDSIVSSQLLQEFQDAYGEMEKTAVSLAVIIAEKILQREIREHAGEIIVNQAINAIRSLEGAKNITLRLHPTNIEALEKAKSTLVDATKVRNELITIVADSSVQEGGCIVDTALGTIDSQVKTQLDTIAKALNEELQSTNQE